MVMNGSTWRKHPLIVGVVYRVTADLPDYTDGTMQPGRSYRLVHIGHSHYDGASVFSFECISTGDRVAWWWFDSSEEQLCSTYFERLS